MVLKVLLSIFPFLFAAILATWSVILIIAAIQAWLHPHAKPNDVSDVVASAFSGIGLALVACGFGAIGDWALRSIGTCSYLFQ